jgi:hypothetical protein
LARPAFELVVVADVVGSGEADVVGSGEADVVGSGEADVLDCPLCTDVEVANVVPVMLCGVPKMLNATLLMALTPCLTAACTSVGTFFVYQSSPVTSG